MSNLLNTAEGRNVVIEAQRHLLRRRISRFFKRNLVIDYEQFSKGLAEFDLGTLLGQLNPAWDDELIDLYRLLGVIGGLSESIADTSIYVNPTTGSDITGTGSLTRPYASLWFLGDDPDLSGSMTPNMLPRRINHNYRILIYGNVVFPGTLTLTHDFGDNGCLSLIGVGEEVEVLAGLGGALTAVVNQQTCAREFDTSVAPTLGCLPYFIQFTSGLDERNVAGVLRVDNAASKVWTRHNPVSNTAVADTYRYVRPAWKLTVDGLIVDCRGSRYVGSTVNYRGSRIVFCNLDIEVEEHGFGIERVSYLSGVPICFAFCRILQDSGNFYPWRFENVEVNKYRPIDADISTLSQTTIPNLFAGAGGTPYQCGVKFIPQNGDNQYDAQSKILEIGDSAWAESIECMASVGGFSASLTIYRSAFKILSLNACNGSLWQMVIDPNKIVDNTIALYCYESNIQQNLILYGTCRRAIYMRNTKFTFNDGGGDVGGTITLIVDYAIQVLGQSALYFVLPWTGTSGTTNDLIFTDLAAPLAAAFPAANTIVTDALGNNASRGA
jgi:hypothetical protein